MLPLKFLAAGVTIETAGVVVPDVNVILNVVAVLLLVVFGPRYLKVRDLQAQLSAKDRTIATDNQSLKSRDDRIAGLEADLEGATSRADRLLERNRKLSEGLAQMQGRYEEQSRYTAREALVTLERLLTHQGEESERRHLELMSALRSIAPAVK